MAAAMSASEDATSFGAQMGRRWAESKIEDVTGETRRETTLNAFGGMVNQIVGGIFAVVLGLIMLNELMTLDIVNSSNGPFASVFSTVESVGGASIIFIVLGFLAAAGGVAVRMFRGGY